ncbi:MAG: hypothetical protein IJT66_04095 [Clostridia bacterium]|nr:hypothetical protein [Clostridia bacterium]
MKVLQKGLCVFLAFMAVVLSLFDSTMLFKTAAASFEKQLSAFPKSYQTALKKLHDLYPNWSFTADQLSITWEEAVQLELSLKVVPKSYKTSWFSMGKGAYDWADGRYVAQDTSWYIASREVIQYYMDVRNFLDDNQIFAFLTWTYQNSQTEAGLKKIVKGTFLEKGYTDENDSDYGGSYVKVIMAAAKKYNLNPYVLAGKIIQEQGTAGTSSLISGTYKGYEGYYNFFNVRTYGNTTAEKIAKGLSYAKENGWSTRSAAIFGGAKFCAEGYVDAGQDTFFYMDFNLKKPERIWHQYATAAYDAYSKAKNLAAVYKTTTDAELEFHIPVYKNMPSSVCKAPEKTDKQNNYYFNSINVAGLTPSFYRFTYEYDLSVEKDTAVYIEVPTGASYTGKGSYSLKKGEQTVALTVRSESGYTNTYTLRILAAKDCVLSVGSEKVPEKEEVTVLRGDTNGDAKINGRDLANIQLHILGLKTLTGSGFTGGDTNNDGKINGRDLANVQLHILDIKKLQ